MNGVRHVLLLVQAAAAGIVAAGTAGFGVIEHSVLLAAAGLLAAALALVPVVVALGLGFGAGWARGLGVAFELLLVISGYANAVVLGNGDLVSVLFTLVLPAALLWTLRRDDRARSPMLDEWSGAGSRAGSTRS